MNVISHAIKLAPCIVLFEPNNATNFKISKMEETIIAIVPITASERRNPLSSSTVQHRVKSAGIRGHWRCWNLPHMKIKNASDELISLQYLAIDWYFDRVPSIAQRIFCSLHGKTGDHGIANLWSLRSHHQFVLLLPRQWFTINDDTGDILKSWHYTTCLQH